MPVRRTYLTRASARSHVREICLSHMIELFASIQSIRESKISDSHSLTRSLVNLYLNIKDVSVCDQVA